LKDDGYEEINNQKNARVGDYVIYTNSADEVQHSVLLVDINPQKEIMVYGHGGIIIKNIVTPIDKAWPLPGTKKRFFRKTKEDQVLNKDGISTLKIGLSAQTVIEDFLRAAKLYEKQQEKEKIKQSFQQVQSDEREARHSILIY
jgi:hypothetical protein